jgi:hypothetical protein
VHTFDTNTSPKRQQVNRRGKKEMIAGRPSTQFYTSQFYDSFASMSHSSARRILSVVFDYLTPRSIADVGCGVGTWLSAASELGCSELTGFDGPWIDRKDLLSDSIELRPVDFEGNFELEGRFDLCLAMEVAEHISESRADLFVEQLCSLSEVVLFSAAIPCQGGAHHVNEQLQSYWIRKFRANSYECFDVIRSRVWHEDDVEFWYRQNSFMFVRTDSSAVDRERLRWDSSQGIYDIVHPGLFAWKLGGVQEPDLRSLARLVRAFVRAKYQRAVASAARTIERLRTNRDDALTTIPDTTTSS